MAAVPSSPIFVPPVPPGRVQFTFGVERPLHDGEPPASGRWQVDQPGYTAPISPWLGPAIGRTTEDVPAQAVRPHRRYSLSSSRYERTTNAHPPSPIDNLYSGISSYRTASHRPLNHRDAPASPTVEPPFPKKKRKRADARSLQVLNEVYNRTAFPSTEEREALAKELDLLPRQVQIWFQSKRASRRNRPEEAYKAESSSSTSRRKRPEEAYKAEPSASTRELEQRVEELENRLAEMHREREGGSPFGSQPFEERAPSPGSTSWVGSSSLIGTSKAHSWTSVHPTLSSWKKLMTRLATAINHVEELVCTTSAEHQPSLRAQVVELRDIFTRHQNRYDEFVKLSKEYADQYLHDLSDEIRSQSAWLDLLERRLELAKTLRSTAVDLGASFAKGVCKELKGVRAAVRACPFDQEAALFDGLDELIGVIKACYVELDKFWTDEVRHVTRALKERRIEQGEGQYWRGLGSTLDGAVNGHSQTPSDTLQSLPRFNASRSHHKLDAPASTLIPAISAIQASLSSARTFRRDFSVLKGKHLRCLEQVYLNVERNKQRCLQFFEGCVDYARKATESACAIFSRPKTERATTMLGLREKATTLFNEGPIAGCPDALTRVPETAGKKVCKSFSKLGAMLRDGEGIWRSILDADTHVFTALMRGEDELSIDCCSIKQLKKMLCRTDKERHILRRLSMTSW